MRLRRGPRTGLGLTSRARCLLAGGLTALLCGLILGEQDLVRAGCLAAAIPVVAAVVVRRSQVTIASRRSADPAHAPAGSGVTISLHVTNRSLLPTGPLMMEDRLPTQLVGRARFVLNGLGGRASRSVNYRIPALGRGRYVAGPLRLRLTDPFRLIDLTRSFTATSNFVIRPVVDPLPGISLPRSWDTGDNAGSHSIGTHGADDASTREYRQGDDLRKIHWRSTARTGALMVRHEERPWQGHTALLIDTRANAHATGTDTESEDVRARSSIEWAISCAASIGAHLLAGGREVSVVAGGGLTRYGSSDAGPMLDQLAVLATSPERDLASLTELAPRVGRDATMVAVLGRLDAASLHLLTELHPRRAATPAFAILLDLDSWAETAEAAASAHAWRHAAAVLRSSGWWVASARRDDSVRSVWTSLLRQRPESSLAPTLGGPR